MHAYIKHPLSTCCSPLPPQWQCSSRMPTCPVYITALWTLCPTFRLCIQPLGLHTQPLGPLCPPPGLCSHSWDLWDVALPELWLLLRFTSTQTSVHPFGTFVANPQLHANPDPLGHWPQSTQPILANLVFGKFSPSLGLGFSQKFGTAWSLFWAVLVCLRWSQTRSGLGL